MNKCAECGGAFISGTVVREEIETTEYPNDGFRSYEPGLLFHENCLINRKVSNLCHAAGISGKEDIVEKLVMELKYEKKETD